MTESDPSTEVRALFAEDVRAFLSRMEVATAVLVETATLAPKAWQGLKDNRPFDAIGDAAQSIRGSASSVNVDFLAESALMVEELARRGAGALELMISHAQRAHAMTAFCTDAMRDMAAMLKLYTGDAPDEASWLAMVLRERAGDVKRADDDELERLADSAPPTARTGSDTAKTSAEDGAAAPSLPEGNEPVEPAGPAAEEFAFDDAAQSPPLARIFLDEAREVLLALKGHVEASLQTRTFSGLERVEPLLHTLKGSAASVELPYLSSQAEDALRLLVELERTKATDVVERFVAAINGLLDTVALPGVSPPSGSQKDSARIILTDVFVGELEGVIESAMSIAEALANPRTTRVKAKALASDAAKLFHRLKGTSLVVGGATMMADEADSVMVACENLANPATLAVAIREGCERITALINENVAAFAFDEPVLPVARASSTPSHVTEPPNFITDGLLVIFREEVTGFLAPLNTNLQRLDVSPRDGEALEALQRLFHTLAGAAAAVGQDPISASASAIERMLDRAIEDTSSIERSFVGELRAKAKEALALVGLDAMVVDCVEELSSDELVEDDSVNPTREGEGASSAPRGKDGRESALNDGTWDAFVAGCADLIGRGRNATSEGDDADELAIIFAEEAAEIAQKIEECFFLLGRDPQDSTAPRVLERLLHTIKGSAATVGRNDLSAASEALRSALEAVSHGVVLTAPRVQALASAWEKIFAATTRPVPRVDRSTAEFAFDEAEQGGDERVDEELLHIFQQEAREALIALHGHVETLMATPTSVYAAEYIERLFHTLKGAAATVGLGEIAKRAADLQRSMEDVLGSKRVPDAAFMDDLVANTNDLLKAIGIAPLVFTGGGPESAGVRSASFSDDSANDIERRIFSGEVKSICRQASGRLRELLATTDVETNRVLRSEIADLFHRLKGTAATVGAHAIATEASRAMETARSKAPPREIADLVRAAIVRIADLAGFARSVARREGGAVRESVEVPDEGELWDSFKQECAEILDLLEKAVLSLEEVAQPKQVVEEIFRHVHTLKGAVNTVGLSPTGRVLHIVEDFLEGLTKAAFMPPMKTVAGLLIDVLKEVRQNLRTAPNGWVETSQGSIAARTSSAMRPGLSSRTDADMSGGPPTGAFRSVFDSAALFGTAAIVSEASANGSRRANSQSASASNSSSDSEASEERAYIRVATSRLDALMNLAGELVVSRSRMASRVGTLRFLYTELGRSRVRLSNTVESFRDQYEFANIGGKATRQAPRREAAVGMAAGEVGPGAGTAGSAELFGALELDEYGDIHVLSRSLAEIGSDFEEAFRTLSSELSSFAEDANSLGGIISGIQGEVTRARMVPLDAVFTRLRFPVRDAATRDGKEVQVITEGADVNIDKTIADAILQPMLHLVRNSVAHGIESAAKRMSAGKDRVGTIRLSARQQSGQIAIEVADDGAGLDLNALRARGIAQGLITPDVSVDDPRVKELVFASGLSTREAVGDVAGRGVGGEVVKRTIDRLNGAIRVETVRGKGTSFVITLPLTLAITRALLVSEGSAAYAVPLYFAERILDAEELITVTTGGERRVLLDGSFSRIRRLDEYFGEGSETARGGPALVLRVGDERLVLQLDAVLGQEEIVVKRAGELLEGHPLFAGVTLRGTGELVMILDVPGLLAEFGGDHRATDDVIGPTRALMPKGGAATVPDASEDGESPKRITDVDAPSDEKAGRKAKAAGVEGRVVVPGRPLMGVRALVVDDSLSVRKVAETHLRGLGVEVTVAVDGVDGLAKLREGRFDIVFTDLEMPRMHGYDFIRQLRLLAAYQDLPVVVVSSRSGQKHQDHARSVGATDYITKPFSAQSLEATIRRWVRG